MPKNKHFFAFKLTDIIFIMLINVKVPTIVGILTLLSMINFMLHLGEHEKSCIILHTFCCLLFFFKTIFFLKKITGIP